MSNVCFDGVDVYRWCMMCLKHVLAKTFNFGWRSLEILNSESSKAKFHNLILLEHKIVAHSFQNCYELSHDHRTVSWTSQSIPYYRISLEVDLHSVENLSSYASRFRGFRKIFLFFLTSSIYPIPFYGAKILLALSSLPRPPISMIVLGLHSVTSLCIRSDGIPCICYLLHGAGHYLKSW